MEKISTKLHFLPEATLNIDLNTLTTPKRDERNKNRF